MLASSSNSGRWRGCCHVCWRKIADINNCTLERPQVLFDDRGILEDVVIDIRLTADLEGTIPKLANFSGYHVRVVLAILPKGVLVFHTVIPQHTPPCESILLRIPSPRPFHRHSFCAPPCCTTFARICRPCVGHSLWKLEVYALRPSLPFLRFLCIILHSDTCPILVFIVEYGYAASFLIDLDTLETPRT